jgi:methylated-DNA-[protein]-cysteine S-methyltransferase
MTYAPHMTTLATPIGSIIITGDTRAVHSIRIGPEADDAVVCIAPADSPVMLAASQMRSYFDGVLHEFDLPLAPLPSARGEALRAAIASIPYAETMSYGALAKAHDSGARAVGGACRRNPLPIIIPCHRVTSSNGAPEHYSAGDGPDTKAWLLAHERRHAVINLTN